MQLRVRKRSTKGVVTAEFVGALAILLPIVLLVVFSCGEVAAAFMIYNALNFSAQSAAMALAKAYGQDPRYATDSSMQQALLSQITYANMVVSPQQFTVQFPGSPSTASWLTTSNIPEVVVTCTFKSGQYGLPPFPNPDPLRLGKNFSLKATAVAYLE